MGLKVTAFVVCLLFTLNTLVWADPDVFLQPAIYTWAANDRDRIETGLAMYIRAMGHPVSDINFHLYPTIKGKKVDLFFNLKRREGDRWVVPAAVNGKSYEAFINPDDLTISFEEQTPRTAAAIPDTSTGSTSSPLEPDIQSLTDTGIAERVPPDEKETAAGEKQKKNITAVVEAVTGAIRSGQLNDMVRKVAGDIAGGNYTAKDLLIALTAATRQDPVLYARFVFVLGRMGVLKLRAGQTTGIPAEGDNVLLSLQIGEKFKDFEKLLLENPRISWGEGDDKVTALMMYDPSSGEIKVFPTRQTLDADPELAKLERKASTAFIPDEGLFGSIRIQELFADNDPAILIDEVQPSIGFRDIKPADKRRKYRDWNKAVCEHVAVIAQKAGLTRAYASTESVIRDRYRGEKQLNQGNLKENYRRPFRENWKKVDAVMGVNRMKLWRRYLSAPPAPAGNEEPGPRTSNYGLKRSTNGFDIYEAAPGKINVADNYVMENLSVPVEAGNNYQAILGTCAALVVFDKEGKPTSFSHLMVKSFDKKQLQDIGNALLPDNRFLLVWGMFDPINMQKKYIEDLLSYLKSRGVGGENIYVHGSEHYEHKNIKMMSEVLVTLQKDGRVRIDYIPTGSNLTTSKAAEIIELGAGNPEQGAGREAPGPEAGFLNEAVNYFKAVPYGNFLKTIGRDRLPPGEFYIFPAVSPDTDQRGQYHQAVRADTRTRSLAEDHLSDTTLPGGVFREIGAAAYELAANCIKRGGGGVVMTEIKKTEDDVILRIVARDLGPGIEDVEKERSDSFSEAKAGQRRGHGFRTLTAEWSPFRKGTIIYQTRGRTWTYDPAKNRFEVTGPSDVKEGLRVTLELSRKQLLSPDVPATVSWLKRLIAPRMPFAEYAVKVAPWVEETLFLALPLGIGHWVLGIGSVWMIALMAVSRAVFFFAHEGARPHAPPAAGIRHTAYRIPLTVAITGFAISLVPIALSSVAASYFLPLTSYFSIAASTLASAATHTLANITALREGRAPATIGSGGHDAERRARGEGTRSGKRTNAERSEAFPEEGTQIDLEEEVLDILFSALEEMGSSGSAARKLFFAYSAYYRSFGEYPSQKELRYISSLSRRRSGPAFLRIMKSLQHHGFPRLVLMKKSRYDEKAFGGKWDLKEEERALFAGGPGGYADILAKHYLPLVRKREERGAEGMAYGDGSMGQDAERRTRAPEQAVKILSAEEERLGKAFREFAGTCRKKMLSIRRHIDEGNYSAIKNAVGQIYPEIRKIFTVSLSREKFKLVLEDSLQDLFALQLLAFNRGEKEKLYGCLERTEAILAEFEKLMAAGRLLDAEKASVGSGLLDASLLLGPSKAEPGKPAEVENIIAPAGSASILVKISGEKFAAILGGVAYEILAALRSDEPLYSKFLKIKGWLYAGLTQDAEIDIEKIDKDEFHGLWDLINNMVEKTEWPDGAKCSSLGMWTTVLPVTFPEGFYPRQRIDLNGHTYKINFKEYFSLNWTKENIRDDASRKALIGSFLERLPVLAVKLAEIARTNGNDGISFKFPDIPADYFKHPDVLVIHYRNPASGEAIRAAAREVFGDILLADRGLRADSGFDISRADKEDVSVLEKESHTQLIAAALGLAIIEGRDEILSKYSKDGGWEPFASKLKERIRILSRQKFSELLYKVQFTLNENIFGEWAASNSASKTPGTSSGAEAEDAADISRLSRLIRSAGGLSMTEKEVLSLIETGKYDSGRKAYLKVHRSGGIVDGYLRATDMSDPAGEKYLHINDIAVREDSRARGIASGLFNDIFELAKSEGYTRFSIWPNHVAVEKIASSHGFKKDGRLYVLSLRKSDPPASIPVAKDLIAPRMPLAEYAVKVAPWVEETLFLALPLGIGHWVLGIGSVWTIALMAVSRAVFFFLHDGARPHAPPTAYRTPLQVALSGFLISLVPVALSSAAASYFLPLTSYFLPLTSYFFIAASTLISVALHTYANVSALRNGLAPAAIRGKREGSYSIPWADEYTGMLKAEGSPDFVPGKVNTEADIRAITAISGVPIDEINRRGRPGEYSQSGFAENIIAQMVIDNETVRQLKTTHAEMSALLRFAADKVGDGSEANFKYNGMRFRVIRGQTRGFQRSIFVERSWSWEYILENIDQGSHIVFAPNSIAEIGQLGFYEARVMGGVKNIYAVDPLVLWRMFNDRKYRVSGKTVQKALEDQAAAIKDRGNWDSVEVYNVKTLKKAYPSIVRDLPARYGDRKPFYSDKEKNRYSKGYVNFAYEVRKKGPWIAVVKVHIIQMDTVDDASGAKAHFYRSGVDIFSNGESFYFEDSYDVDDLGKSDRPGLADIFEATDRPSAGPVQPGERWFYQEMKRLDERTLRLLALMAGLRSMEYDKQLHQNVGIKMVRSLGGGSLLDHLEVAPLDNDGTAKEIPLERQRNIILGVLAEKTGDLRASMLGFLRANAPEKLAEVEKIIASTGRGQWTQGEHDAFRRIFFRHSAWKNRYAPLFLSGVPEDAAKSLMEEIAEYNGKKRTLVISFENLVGSIKKDALAGRGLAKKYNSIFVYGYKPFGENKYTTDEALRALGALRVIRNSPETAETHIMVFSGEEFEHTPFSREQVLKSSYPLENFPAFYHYTGDSIVPYNPRHYADESLHFPAANDTQAPPKTPPAGSIHGVFKYLCDNERNTPGKAASAEDIAKALDRSYETIKYDLRALYYRLCLIDKTSSSDTGKKAKYFVTESVRKKRDEILPILAAFTRDDLRPKNTLLDETYAKKILPVIARHDRKEMERERLFENIRERFLKRGFTVNDVKYIWPQHIAGLGESERAALNIVDGTDGGGEKVTIPPGYLFNRSEDVIITRRQAISCMLNEIAKNTDHIDIDDEAFLAVRHDAASGRIDIAYYDNGAGDPKAARMFGKRYTSTGRPDRGYGLKLIKHLAETMGGNIRFRSGPKFGTFILLRIPLIPGQKKPAEKTNLPEAGTGTGQSVKLEQQGPGKLEFRFLSDIPEEERNKELKDVLAAGFARTDNSPMTAILMRDIYGYIPGFKPEQEIFITFEDGHPVATYNLLLWKKFNEAYGNGLHVLPEKRKGGIGSRTRAALFRKLAQEGYRTFISKSVESSREAQRFQEKLLWEHPGAASATRGENGIIKQTTVDLLKYFETPPEEGAGDAIVTDTRQDPHAPGQVRLTSVKPILERVKTELSRSAKKKALILVDGDPGTGKSSIIAAGIKDRFSRCAVISLDQYAFNETSVDASALYGALMSAASRNDVIVFEGPNLQHAIDRMGQLYGLFGAEGFFQEQLGIRPIAVHAETANENERELFVRSSSRDRELYEARMRCRQHFSLSSGYDFVFTRRAPSVPAEKETNNEKSIPDTAFDPRDLSDPEQIALSIVEALLSISYDKKIVLAFDSEMAACHGARCVDIAEAIDRLKKNPALSRVLARMEVIKTPGEDLSKALEKHLGRDDTEIFVFARTNIREKLTGIENLVHPAYVDEKDLPLDSYYPLAEVIAIALLEYARGTIADKAVISSLEVGGRVIPLSELNILNISRQEGALIFKLLPNAEPCDLKDLIKRYAEVKRFLKSA